MQLYELAAADGRLFSPPCWRSRLSLEWHQLDLSSVATTYSGIKKIDKGQFTTLPVLRDGEKMMADSWEINKYLDTVSGKSIFRTPAEEAQALLVQQLMLVPRVLRMAVMDIFAAVAEEDKDYFRASREKRFNMRLEEAQLSREESIAELVASYQSLENYFGERSLLGGDDVNYADIIVLSHLQMPIQMAKLDFLARLPAMRKWVERCAQRLPSINIWL